MLVGPLTLDRISSMDGYTRPDPAGHPRAGRPPPVRLPQLRLHYNTTPAQATPPATAAPAGTNQDDHDAREPSPSDRKRPRYLSDIDRSVIIQRLEKGEKQASLAREFGVTRAAVCHINKHKGQELTRFDTFARTPRGRVLIENYSRPSSEFASVTEVRTAAATVLMTRLLDRTTPPLDFRSAASRLTRILLEEALANYASRSFAASSPSTGRVELLNADTTPCAVALGSEGCSMLEVFGHMEPDAPRGWIKGPEPYSDSSESKWRVMCLDLPEGIAAGSVLLLTPACASPVFVGCAIEELRSRGVPDASVCIVCLTVSPDAARDIASQHPGVNIVTAAVDRQRQASGGGDLENLIARYSAQLPPTATS